MGAINYYRVIQWHPDQMTGEFINVGVVCYGDGQGPRFALIEDDEAAIRRAPWYAPGSCPDCGARVTIDCDCPGWGNPVMVCQRCCNATLYECENRECGWAFRIPNSRDSAKGPPPTEWEAADVMNPGDEEDEVTPNEDESTYAMNDAQMGVAVLLANLQRLNRQDSPYRCRELSLAITELEVVGFWLGRAIDATEV